MRERIKGICALLTAAILYGFFGIFSRLISFNVPLFFQQWTRNLFISVLLIGLVWGFKRWRNVNKKDYMWFLLRSLGGFISFITLYIGFIKLTISTNYFVSYGAATVGGFVYGALLFSERLNKTKGMSLLCSLVGLYLVYQINLESGKELYVFFSFVGGLATAAWGTFSKKISGTYSNLQLNLIDFVIATFLSLSASLLLKEHWAFPSFNFLWLYLLLFALLFLATGILVVYGFSKVEAQVGSLILLFDVLVGIFLGWIFFGETVPFLSLIGGLLILTAIVLPHMRAKHLSH